MSGQSRRQQTSLLQSVRARRSSSNGAGTRQLPPSRGSEAVAPAATVADILLIQRASGRCQSPLVDNFNGFVAGP